MIEEAWENRNLLQHESYRGIINSVVDRLDQGLLRVAEPTDEGWRVNEWVKKAVILYFPIRQMETIEVGPFEFFDKIPLKKKLCSPGGQGGASCHCPIWKFH